MARKRIEFEPKKLLQSAAKFRGTLLPIAALTLILVILRPLPPVVMDVLLVANITLSAVVLITVMYIEGPLAFSSFPSLLLSMTLLRLVLNVGTTRLILTNAQLGVNAAGKVVATFGDFVAGGNLMVGVLIFAIIVIIQFVVITKGTTRISEVTARFALDGMPGKQLAIDADLGAGRISEQEAKERRLNVTREADFYSSMDGASKFVRGDAVAGIVITAINIAGGLVVGMLSGGMSFADTLTVYTTLTIGDGLASQIPSFIISIAAGMIVTRAASRKNLGDELISQVTASPLALALAAGFLCALLFTPLPKAPLTFLAVACVGIAMTVHRSQLALATSTATAARAKPKKAMTVEDHIAPSAVSIEVGFGLINIVDPAKGSGLTDSIGKLRNQIASELGVIAPKVYIKDFIKLGSSEYVIKLKGIEVARGELVAGHLLAIDSGTVTEPIQGMTTTEPVFGQPAVWIEPDQRHTAEHRNYMVLEPVRVLIVHLSEVLKRHADELLTRQQMSRLLDALAEHSPKLVEELVPETVKPGLLQQVCRNLLRERVPIRDLETILETVGDLVGRTRDPDILAEQVRNALARTICHLHRNDKGKIPCVTLDPELENVIQSQIEHTDAGSMLTLAPEVKSRICDAVAGRIEEASKGAGQSPVVLCSPQIRFWLRRMIEARLPQVAVLAYNEIVRGVEVDYKGMVTISNEAEDVSR